VIVGERTVLSMELLTPDGVTIRTERAASGTAPIVLCYSRAARQWRNAVALSWSGMQKTPPEVAMQTDGDISTFFLGDKTLVFDWELGRVNLEP
jgi:hypothetical protein